MNIAVEWTSEQSSFLYMKINKYNPGRPSIKTPKDIQLLELFQYQEQRLQVILIQFFLREL